MLSKSASNNTVHGGSDLDLLDVLQGKWYNTCVSTLSAAEDHVVTIQLNGEPRNVPDALSLAALIEWLKLPGDRVAVERNLEIVPRALWNETSIEAGDRLEVVHLVGGGFSGSCSDGPWPD